MRARQRVVVLPPLIADTLPARRAARPTTRDQRGLRTMAVVLGFVLTGTIFGLVYLTQTLQAAGARYEIDALSRQRQTLLRELQSQQATIARLGSEPVVVSWAQREGLERLGAKIRVRGR